MTSKKAQLQAERYQQLGLGPRWVRRSAAPPPVQTGETPAARPVNVKPVPSAVQPANPTGSGHPAAPLPSTSNVAQLDWPALEEAVQSCQLCHLSETRKNTVFGMGDRTARLMIIGEAPGAEEDRQGLPFVGQAGKLLDNMLASIRLSREHGVFIANVLKCRPPQNRNPQVAEVSCCSPYLARQIELVRPDVILALGRYAVNTVLQTDAPIASLRGRQHQYQNIPVIVSYHPAYLLRNLPDKFKAWEDLARVRKMLAQISAEESA